MENPAPTTIPAQILSAAADPSQPLEQSLFELLATPAAVGGPLVPAPRGRSEEIARAAAWKAATVSGTLAIPPGPLGMLTVIPDLLTIWRIQARMVADIAAVYGRQTDLGREHMAYCLFKHAAAQAVTDLTVRAGPRVVVKTLTTTAMKRFLQRVGVTVGKRVLFKSTARWVPILGAVATGAFAYRDTLQVAHTAIQLFSSGLTAQD